MLQTFTFSLRLLKKLTWQNQHQNFMWHDRVFIKGLALNIFIWNSYALVPSLDTWKFLVSFWRC